MRDTNASTRQAQARTLPTAVHWGEDWGKGEIEMVAGGNRRGTGPGPWPDGLRRPEPARAAGEGTGGLGRPPGPSGPSLPVHLRQGLERQAVK